MLENKKDTLQIQGVNCLVSSLYFAGAQATGTYIDFFWCTVHNNFYFLNVWHPFFLCSDMGVAHLHTHISAFAADFTFSRHQCTPPSVGYYILFRNYRLEITCIIVSERYLECKINFVKNQ